MALTKLEKFSFPNLWISLSDDPHWQTLVPFWHRLATKPSEKFPLTLSSKIQGPRPLPPRREYSVWVRTCCFCLPRTLSPIFWFQYWFFLWEPLASGLRRTVNQSAKGAGTRPNEANQRLWPGNRNLALNSPQLGGKLNFQTICHLLLPGSTHLPLDLSFWGLIRSILPSVL